MYCEMCEGEKGAWKYQNVQKWIVYEFAVVVSFLTTLNRCLLLLFEVFANTKSLFFCCISNENKNTPTTFAWRDSEKKAEKMVKGRE